LRYFKPIIRIQLHIAKVLSRFERTVVSAGTVFYRWILDQIVIILPIHINYAWKWLEGLLLLPLQYCNNLVNQG
jgi:hypothetical protein